MYTTVHVDKEMTTANLGYLGQDGSSVRKQVSGTRKHGQNMVKFSMLLKLHNFTISTYFKTEVA